MCQTSLGECFSRAVRWQQSPEEGLMLIKIRLEEEEHAEDALFTHHLEHSSRQLSLALVSEEQGSLLRAEMCLLLALAETNPSRGVQGYCCAWLGELRVCKSQHFALGLLQTMLFGSWGACWGQLI